MTTPIRIALFASGTGSNAVALAEAAHAQPGAVEIALLICDQPQAPVLAKIRRFGIEAVLLPRAADRATHEQAVLARLAQARADWIFLAGYMRLLSGDFVARWRAWHGGAQQIVNVHPSRLPAYRGLHAVEQALAAGETEIGVTLHHVDAGMDTGRIIAQDAITRREHEDMADLMARLHPLEHRLYTQFLLSVADGRTPTARFREPAPC